MVVSEVTTEGYGDTSTHIFNINTFVDPVASPELSTTGANPANPYVSLDWACFSCHNDEIDSVNFYTWATNAIEGNGGVHGN